MPFFNCRNNKVDDPNLNDGRNTLVATNLMIGSVLPKTTIDFNFGWLLITFHDPNLDTTWRRPVFCDFTKGGDNNYYITGSGVYSLTTNFSIIIKINPQFEIVDITLTSEWADHLANYEITYTELIGVGVI